jgi:branched-subunit amino acid ABC-type transport system permease component
MIGLFLLYFIGKAYYDLAGDHNKHTWGHAILGIVMYYAGTMIGGLIIGVILALYSPQSLENLDNGNEFFYSLMAVPFGLLTCWLVYRLLKSRWKNLTNDNNTLDGDFLN